MSDIYPRPANNDTLLEQPPTDGRIQTPQMTATQLTQIGANAAKNGLVDVARVAFLKAVKEERRGDTLANLANVLRQLWRFDEANKCIDEALQFAPQDGRVWGIKGAILLDQNRSQEAIGAFQNSLMWGGAAPFTKFGLAEAQLHAGDFDRGLKGYESRFEIHPPRMHPMPRWQGEPLGDRVLLVEAEQGFGDAFMFSRFLSRIPGNYIFSVQAQATSLFGPDTKRLGEAVRADYWCPLMSLPLIVGTDITPALNFRPNRILPLTARGKFNIGIVWTAKAGGSGSAEEMRHGLQKSCPLEAFLELCDIDGVQLHSLQYDQDASMMTMDLVNQLPQYDFRDQAAHMLNMDLIISVDTAPIHLAATLGRPCIVLLNWTGSWQWTAGDTTPWYSTLRIVRQPAPFDWRGAMAEAKALVVEMMACGHLPKG